MDKGSNRIVALVACLLAAAALVLLLASGGCQRGGGSFAVAGATVAPTDDSSLGVATNVGDARVSTPTQGQAAQDIVQADNPSQGSSSRATEPQESDVAISIVVDVSGSMGDSSAYGSRTKLEGAQDQASAFARSSMRGDGEAEGLSTLVGVCSFTDVAYVECDLTADVAQVTNAIASLSPLSRTNMYAGLETGINQLMGRPGIKLMIFLSDGLSNDGPGRSDIISLAHTAADNDIIIYTIGYGGAGDIDEDLLREIATITGGTYSHEDPSDASAASVGLYGSMMDARLQQTHDLLMSQTGSVAQGQTVEAGTFEVTDSGTLTCYLYWPGSSIDIELTDPVGTKVSPGYAGYACDTSSIPTVVTVQAAKLGTWAVAVYGREVSMDTEPFYTAAAFKQVAAPTGGGGGAVNNSGPVLLFLLIVVALGSILGVYALTLRGRKHG